MQRDRDTERGFLGHPRALGTLFGMEVWERFSFYGMQAILLIYLYYETARGGLAVDQSAAIGIVGAYGSAVYLAATLGAWVADRLLGPERTLFISGFIVMLGHTLLALVPRLEGLVAGMICIALGSGGVKANCASLVGALYEPGSRLRDAGFSLFYLGINLGAVTGPLLTGILQTSLGFHVGFGLAAVGMAFGLWQYARGRKRLPPGQQSPPMPLAPGQGRYYAAAAIGIVLLAGLAILVGWLRADNLSAVLVTIIALLAAGYFVLIAGSRRISDTERRRVQAFVPLFITSAIFWSLFSQSTTVITAFFDQRVARQVLDWTIPVGWFVSMKASYIVVLSGLFTWLWTSLGSRQPSSATKFVLAMTGIGVSYLGFLPYLGSGQIMPLGMLLLLMLGFTCSEMCISPIGLSVATKLAPAAFQTQMMALFYMSMALGFATGGQMGTFYSQDSEVIYFVAMGAIGLATAIGLLCCLPFIHARAFAASSGQSE